MVIPPGGAVGAADMERDGARRRGRGREKGGGEQRGGGMSHEPVSWSCVGSRLHRRRPSTCACAGRGEGGGMARASGLWRVCGCAERGGTTGDRGEEVDRRNRTLAVRAARARRHAEAAPRELPLYCQTPPPRTFPHKSWGGRCAGGAHMHSGGLPSAANTHTPPTRRQADTGERNTGHRWCACVARNHGDARETTVLRHSRACEGMRRGSHMTPSQGAGEAASKGAGQAGSRSQVRSLPAVVVVIVVVGCSAGSGCVGECSPRSCTSSCLICTRGGGE